MLQTLQGTRRPAQQVGQQAGGDQARFEAGTLRREHRQDRPAQQLQRQRRRQQAEQYRQARGPGVSLASQEQTEGGQHQGTDQRPRQLPEDRGFRPLHRPLAGEATFQHQHREGQQQADTDGEVGRLPGTGRRQVETPAGGYQAQRQRRARRQPQRSVPELGQAVGDGLAQALQQPFIGAVGGGVGFVPLPAQPGRPRAGLRAEDHATPGRDPVGRVQTGEQDQPAQRRRRPMRRWPLPIATAGATAGAPAGNAAAIRRRRPRRPGRLSSSLQAKLEGTGQAGANARNFITMRVKKLS